MQNIKDLCKNKRHLCNKPNYKSKQQEGGSFSKLPAKEELISAVVWR